MRYQTLENTSLAVICNAFNEAFSDYQVSMDISIDEFKKMLKRKGFEPSLSIGAFDDNKLVGFVLNGLRIWNDNLTIYDLGTGVLPDYRHQGIIRNILKLVNEKCLENNISYYLLEVIKDNTNAVTLYQKQGFEINRNFDCFLGNYSILDINDDIDICYLDEFDLNIWQQLVDFWDYQPSWQNSIDSINAVVKNFIYILAYKNNEIVGYGVFEKNGTIVQMATSKLYRNQHISSKILNSFVSDYGVCDLRMINVDSCNNSLISFLKNRNFNIYVRQYEMVKEI